MKKMEEMMELLTEELAGFDNSVKKLELLSKHLASIKVSADNSATERLIKAHLSHEKSLVASYEQKLQKLEKTMVSARLYPEWLTNLFWIGLVVTLFTIGYFGYQGFMFQESREAAYQKGQDHIIAHFTEYFDHDPKAYEAYTKWKEQASRVPSGK